MRRAQRRSFRALVERRALTRAGAQRVSDGGRDLFYGLWIPDLFMKRVEEDAEWSLMCPSQCPGLDDVWGEDFEALYTRYEKVREGRRPP